MPSPATTITTHTHVGLVERSQDTHSTQVTRQPMAKSSYPLHFVAATITVVAQVLALTDHL